MSHLTKSVYGIVQDRRHKTWKWDPKELIDKLDHEQNPYDKFKKRKHETGGGQQKVPDRFKNYKSKPDSFKIPQIDPGFYINK